MRQDPLQGYISGEESGAQIYNFQHEIRGVTSR